MEIQFNNTPLIVEQTNYATKIRNAYMIYDLYNWPRIPLRNFTLNNYLFDAINIIIKSIIKSGKSKYMYKVIKDYWNFGNGFTSNIIIFEVDNS